MKKAMTRTREERKSDTDKKMLKGFREAVLMELPRITELKRLTHFARVWKKEFEKSISKDPIVAEAFLKKRSELSAQ